MITLDLARRNDVTTQVIDRPETQTPVPTRAPDKEMTEEEFLQKFAEAAPYFTWGTNQRGTIGGFPEDVQVDSPPNCPITAVVRILTGKFYRISEYYLAAEAIGLPRGLANQIVVAADNSNSHDPLRQRLLRIAGLK